MIIKFSDGLDGSCGLRQWPRASNSVRPQPGLRRRGPAPRKGRRN